MKTITKSELARRLKVSPAAVTLYCKKGMPVMESGKVNLKAALEWHRIYVAPERSGSFKSRQRAKIHDGIRSLGEKSKPAKADSSIEGKEDSPLLAQRVLMDTILLRRNLIPQILVSIGVKDQAFIHASPDILTAMIFGLGDADDLYDWDVEDIPPAATDIEAIFQRYGLELTPETVVKADEMTDRAFEAIEQAIAGKASDAN